MQYRNFGKLEFKVSTLGFGCMRLPLKDNKKVLFLDREGSNIDEEKAIKIIRYAIDNGVNYIDTAYPYHNGNSEVVVGKALKNGYRNKVYLATKLPVWLTKSYDDFNKYLDEQLEKLSTNYIDFYLLHGLNKRTWTKVKSLGVLDFLDESIKKGKIKYAGFSFHDGLDVFKEIIDTYPWSFCQIQLNYMDDFFQAGIEGMKYAASKGLGIVIMEPLKGGKLANDPPKEVKEVINEYPNKKSPAEWALRWVLNHTEVSVVLSGMNEMEHIVENINTANNTLPLSITQEELDIIKKVKNTYKNKIKVDCTSCGYCMPCPTAGIVIPEIFEIYNNFYMYNTKEESLAWYERMKKAKRDPSVCIECGKCEEICPQNLPIIKLLKEVNFAFENQ